MSLPNDSCWATPRSPAECSVLTQPVTNNVMPNENDIMEEDQLIKPKIKRLRHPTESIGLIRFIFSLGNFLLSMVLSALFLVLAILIVPVCYIFRKSTQFLAKYNRNRRGSNVIEMSLSDCVWFRDFPNVNTAAVSTIFLVFEGKLSIAEVRAFIEQNWLHYCDVKRQETFPKLKREAAKVTAGYGWKENGKFQLEEYVLEADGKVALDLAALNVTMDTGDRINSSYSERQLWKITVFPEYSRTHDTGVLLKMHESIADFFPFMRLTLESLQYRTVYLKEKCFLLKRLCLYLCAAFAGPLLILQRLLMRKDVGLSTIRSPACDSEGFVSCLWSEGVDLKTANRIKDITRTKVEVVLISCLAGAVRSYLHKCGLPSARDIRVCMKVDVRLRHSPIKLDNQFSFVFIKLPVGTEGAVPRLWETRRRLSTLSCTLERYVTWGFIKLCLLIFPLKIVQRIINFLMNKVSCTLIHLPGPDTPVYLNGKMAKLMTIWVPRESESGMTFSLVSHGNQVRLGLLAYHPMPCDPKLLLSDFEREVRLLAKHLENRSVPSQRWRSRQARQLANKEEKDDQGKESEESV